MSGFVIGEPPARLIRPHCEGMHPTFKRMRRPHAAVVEMRTQGTRTFGFFHLPNVFVAHVVTAADDVKREAGGYVRRAEAVEIFMSRLAPDQIDGTCDVAQLVT